MKTGHEAGRAQAGPIAVGMLLGLLAATMPAARGEDPTSDSQRVFEHSPGVRINVTLTRDASDAEIAQALENAARELRERQRGAGVAASAEPAPAPAEGRPPAPARIVAAPGPVGSQAEPCGPEHKRKHWLGLPATLLWQPPLANQREPRMFLKHTSFDNPNTGNTIDTAIGGSFGFVRCSSDEDCTDGVEFGFAGAVFTRFSEADILVGADYRFGFPITWRRGPWEGKIAFEHTSAHLGDDFIEASGRRRIDYVRDEIVLGLAYRFLDQFRVYGQIGIAPDMVAPEGHDKGDRYNFGLEWSGQGGTGFRGQPFAAVDVDIRADQDYQFNVTGQVGWEWKHADHRPGVRLAVEGYDGRSPYGQFFQDRESCFGVVLLFDF